MPITYEQLEDRSGTIYNKATGKAYGEGLSKTEANKQLAADLGVEPHKIDWLKISQQTTNVPEKKSDLDGLSDQALKIPEVETFNGNGIDMTSGFGSLSEFYAQQAKDIAEQIKVVGAGQQDLMDKAGGLLDKETKVDLTTQAYEDIGIDPKKYFSSLQAGYDEIGGLRDQYNTVELEMNNALNITENQLASTTFIRGEKAVIQVKYNQRLSKINSDISSKAAVLQAKQGLFSEAKQFVKDAVASSIYDQEKDYDMLTKFVDVNQKIIDGMSDDYKDAINSALENSQKAYEEIKEEKTDIGDMMIEYPEAGINLNMTREEAVEAAQDYLAATGGVEEFELRTVGNKLYAINPRTLEKTLIAESSGTDGISPYQQWQIDKYNFEEQKEVISGFYKDMNDAKNTMEGYSPTGYKTREALIDELQSKYPDLLPQDIEVEIYNSYPDLTPEQIKAIQTKGTPYYFPVFPGVPGS